MAVIFNMRFPSGLKSKRCKRLLILGAAPAGVAPRIVKPQDEIKHERVRHRLTGEAEDCDDVASRYYYRAYTSKAIARTRLREVEGSPRIVQKPSVLLIHGLWMNRFAMLYLTRAIAAQGFRARAIGYLSALRDFEQNAARIARAIAAPGEHVHLVAHSLGGLVVLRALERVRDARVRRLVLLGSPIAGSVGGRQMAASRWGAALLGRTKSFWASTPPLDIPAEIEAGAIAGTRRFGLGRLVVKLPSPNDGVVTVEETHHPRLADHITLPVGHSQMIFSKAVARQTARFLETGRFAR
jgi:pimeloyl-ACP methyl ester carboxylesterase